MKDASPVFKISEIAAACAVSRRTALRWVEEGRLAAHRLPGGRSYRVRAEDLLEFCRTNDMPIPRILAGNNRRVLIVEDEEDLAETMSAILVGAEFEVMVALNGFEAGALLSSFQPCVMTLDIRMPGMGGMEMIRYAMEKCASNGGTALAQTKILVVSAVAPNEIQRALDAGAHDALRKPFAMDDLIRKVAALAGRDVVVMGDAGAGR